MSQNSSQPMPNPGVYLNYLQPADALEYEATRNVFLATLGALLWDILSSLPDDWTLIRTTSPSPVLFAYFSSRTCALAVVLMSTLARTGPVQQCNVLELILCVFWVLASASSSYLFLKRVHAVFPQEGLAHHTFTLLWIAGVGASTVILPGLFHGLSEIANTKHCVESKIKNYVPVAFLGPVFFDMIVYYAICFKLLRSHRTGKRTWRWKMFCNPSKYLPHFSRAVFRGGQQYYSITNGVNQLCFISALQPNNYSPLFLLLPLVPAVALTSAMACRVFRNLKLEALHKTEVDNLTTIHFVDRERPNVLPQKTGASTPTDVDLEQG